MQVADAATLLGERLFDAACLLQLPIDGLHFPSVGGIGEFARHPVDGDFQRCERPLERRERHWRFGFRFLDGPREDLVEAGRRQTEQPGEADL